jgi:hypothetical protein
MYLELSLLYLFIKEHEVSVSFSGKIVDELLSVTLKSKSKEWELFIDNEYDDFDVTNQPVCIYLALRALDDYCIEQNFKNWSRYYSLGSNSAEWKTYFDYLGKAYDEIETEWGSIDTFLKDDDYLMCDGAYVELLKTKV